VQAATGEETVDMPPPLNLVVPAIDANSEDMLRERAINNGKKPATKSRIFFWMLVTHDSSFNFIKN
jgi:hypothetical protein